MILYPYHISCQHCTQCILEFCAWLPISHIDRSLSCHCILSLVHMLNISLWLLQNLLCIHMPLLWWLLGWYFCYCLYHCYCYFHCWFWGSGRLKFHSNHKSSRDWYMIHSLRIWGWDIHMTHQLGMCIQFYIHTFLNHFLFFLCCTLGIMFM